jgi:hypothetical protein
MEQPTNIPAKELPRGDFVVTRVEQHKDDTDKYIVEFNKDIVFNNVFCMNTKKMAFPYKKHADHQTSLDVTFIKHWYSERIAHEVWYAIQDWHKNPEEFNNRYFKQVFPIPSTFRIQPFIDVEFKDNPHSVITTCVVDLSPEMRLGTIFLCNGQGECGKRIRFPMVSPIDPKENYVDGRFVPPPIVIASQFETAEFYIRTGEYKRALVKQINDAYNRKMGKLPADGIGKEQDLFQQPEKLPLPGASPFLKHVKDENGDVFEATSIAKDGSIFNLRGKATTESAYNPGSRVVSKEELEKLYTPCESDGEPKQEVKDKSTGEQFTRVLIDEPLKQPLVISTPTQTIGLPLPKKECPPPNKETLVAYETKRDEIVAKYFLASLGIARLKKRLLDDLENEDELIQRLNGLKAGQKSLGAEINGFEAIHRNGYFLPGEAEFFKTELAEVAKKWLKKFL